MKSYIIKPKSVKKSEILRNEYSFSGFSYRFVESKNKNYFLLGSNEILDKNVKGFEPGSKEYIDFSENYFVRISEMDNLNFTFATSKDTKKIRPVENSNKSKIINQGDVCYQTASNVGNVCIYDGKKAFYNSHIRKLAFKKNKYYIFAILKSAFGKEQVDVSGSIKGVDNFREEYLLNTKIPFPTTANHQNPEKVENLVSLIVQNIIDKEEQIKLKNKQIDELIEKELKENQKTGSFSYNYPRLSEIKEETRFDTGLYKKEFKEIDFLIRNYEGGYTNFEDSGFKRKKGPNLAISVIGRSYYSDIKHNKNFKQLILSKHVTDEGGLKATQYIGSSAKLPTLKRFDFLLFARGDIGRVILIDDFLVGATSNFDVFFISSEKEYWENIFTLCYLKYLRGINFWEFYGVGGSGASSLTDYYFKKVNLPNFPKSKQQEIATLYYNPLEKNKDLSLENYLEREQTRNRETGIFQLNMEIFSLREQLEDLVHKIVMEEKIELRFEY